MQRPSRTGRALSHNERPKRAVAGELNHLGGIRNLGHGDREVVGLRAPDRLDADIFNQLPRVRDGRIHVRAIVAVVGLQFVGLAVHDKTAGVVDLLHGKLDGVVNGVSGRNERSRQGGVHADLDDVLGFSSGHDDKRRYGGHTQQCASHWCFLLARPRSTIGRTAAIPLASFDRLRTCWSSYDPTIPKSIRRDRNICLTGRRTLRRRAARPCESTLPPSVDSHSAGGIFIENQLMF